MNVTPTAEQQELRATARRFLEEVSSTREVRRLSGAEEPFDAATWKRLAQLGWLSLALPEGYGGAGMTTFDLVLLMEEMGRALLPAPFFSTICLAAPAILAAGSEEQKRTHLPAIGAGDTVATLAVCEEKATWDGRDVETAATPADGGWTLSGTKLFVPDGSAADLLIVAARTPAGPTLYLVDGGAPGVTRRQHRTMDATRRLSEVTLDGVAVPAAAMLGPDGGAVELLVPVLQLAAIALAAEQVGGAQRVLDMSVAYAKERVQFDRAIGSFQAIKHKCADMLLEVESARSGVYYAAWTADEAPEEMPLAASLAKAYASDTYYHAAAETIQIHGGIGFTWEHDAHLFFKRAASSQIMLGSAAQHRERIAELVGL